MKELNLLLIIARQKDHLAYEKYFARRNQLNKGTRKGQRMISTRKETQQGKTNRGIT